MLSYKRIFHCKYLFDFLKEDISYQISPISPKKNTQKVHPFSLGTQKALIHLSIHLPIHPSIQSIHPCARRASGESATLLLWSSRLLRPSCCCRDCGGRRSSNLRGTKQILRKKCSRKSRQIQVVTVEDGL